jgi:hypothetical protein
LAAGQFLRGPADKNCHTARMKLTKNGAGTLFC